MADFLWLLFVAAICPAQSPPPVNEEPIILPEYKVTAWKFDTDPEHWTYASWGDIEVISNAGGSETIRILKSMSAVQQAMATIMPGFQSRSMLPFYIIIHEKSLTRALLVRGLPSERDPDCFRIRQDGRDIAIISTTVISQKETTAAQGAIRENNTGSILMGKVGTGAKTRNPVESTLYYRGTIAAKMYLQNRLHEHFPPLPRWYLSTIDELIKTASFEGEWMGDPVDPDSGKIANKVTMGQIAGDDFYGLWTESLWRHSRRNQTGPGTITMKIDTARGDINITSLQSERKRIRPLPMDQMFAPMPQYKQFEKTHPANFLLSQCVIFWHYCWLRKDAGKLRQGYLQLVQKAAEGSITEDVFRECMGMGFEDMENALFNYMGPEHYKQGFEKLTVTFNASIHDIDLPLRTATRAEVARIKGEAFAFQGKFDLARRTMLAIYDRNKADPALCASLGVLEYKAGDLEKARPLLALAVREGVRNPEAWRTLARIKLDDALGVKKGKKPKPGKRLAQEQVDEIYILLAAAREMPPARAETYVLLEELFSYSDEKPTDVQTALVEEGRRWFPGGQNPAPYPRAKLPVLPKPRDTYPNMSSWPNDPIQWR